MPINYQQAVTQIREMGERAPRRAEILSALREQAMKLLIENAEEGQALRELVERGGHLNPRVRSAVPTDERLDASIAAQAVAEPFAILAADGSQINPDRHSMVEFGAINVGSIRMCPGQPPRERTLTRLLFDEDLYINNAPLTEEVVALWRDRYERELLFELAQEDRKAGLTVVTLTDGPLELFREQGDNSEYKKQLEAYLKVLRELAKTGAATAGYVDKPRSDTLVNLLGMILLEQDGRLSRCGEEHPLWPVRDLDLFSGLLQPGERSAVFGLRSKSSEKFTDELSLHFFYLNVGRAGDPHLARVEIPRWVAGDARMLNLLHAALLEQSLQMGARPFPYIIHRAHEVAVVSFQEKDQLEIMIAAELRRQGLDVGASSNKQSAKDLEGRTRLKR
jgi:hypothetical protein